MSTSMYLPQHNQPNSTTKGSSSISIKEREESPIIKSFPSSAVPPKIEEISDCRNPQTRKSSIGKQMSQINLTDGAADDSTTIIIEPKRNIDETTIEDDECPIAAKRWKQLDSNNNNNSKEEERIHPTVRFLSQLEEFEATILPIDEEDQRSVDTTASEHIPQIPSILFPSSENGANDIPSGTFRRASFHVLTHPKRNSSDDSSCSEDEKKRQMNLLLDKVSNTPRSKRKKLILSCMNLTLKDIPVDDICTYPLGDELHKLSLTANRLSAIPSRLVMDLKGLQTLDLQQCDLLLLPECWNLPKLKRLDLSHNRLIEFPDENFFAGLPSLQHLSMYGNQISEINLPPPSNTTKPQPNDDDGTSSDDTIILPLETLNLGDNSVSTLPHRFHQVLPHLKSLLLMNNSLQTITQQICEMGLLEELDVTSNPLIQPPMETCERGIKSMRRYYHCLAWEKEKRLTKNRRKSGKRMMPLQTTVRSDWDGELLREQISSSFETESTVDDGCCGDTTKTNDLLEQTSFPRCVAVPSSIHRIKPEEVVMQHPNVDHVVQRFHADTNKRSSPEKVNKGFDLPQQDYHRTISNSDDGDDDVVVVPTNESETMTISHHSIATEQQHRRIACTEHELSLTEEKKEEESSLPQQITDPVLRSDIDVVIPTPTRHDPEDESDDPLPPQNVYPTANEIKIESACSQIKCDTEWDDTSSSDEITHNDTLKVIFVGMANAGKTSIIERLLRGNEGVIPQEDERTIGVDIYDWDPANTTTTTTTTGGGVSSNDGIDTRVEMEDGMGGGLNRDVDVKFSVWDFAGQHVYHATHELFFSPRALYVIVWDMAAKNQTTRKTKRTNNKEQGSFKLCYDSSDDDSSSEDEDDYLFDDELKRAESALNEDIDQKVQFWIDCIQSRVPGAAILPVASFDDYFDSVSGCQTNNNEAKRRCDAMKRRILEHEKRRKEGIALRLQQLHRDRRAHTEYALRLKQLLCPLKRPKLLFDEIKNDDDDEYGSVMRVSSKTYRGFERLRRKIVDISTGRERAGWKYPIFRGHVGARIPHMWLEVRDVVREMRRRFFVVEWGHFIKTLKEHGIENVEDVSDALHFLTDVGELSYFGGVMMKGSGGEGCTSSLKDVVSKEIKTNQVLQIPEASDDDDLEEEDDIIIDDCMPEPYNEYLTNNSDEQTQTKQTTTSTIPPASIDTNERPSSGALSQFIFLNPRWLVAALACILRHDLSRKIYLTRRAMGIEHVDTTTGGLQSFYDANLNCPIITASDACLLWNTQKVTKKAALRAEEHASPSADMSPYEFLQLLLVRFNVFVPIDLSIEKALLGGMEYGRCDDDGGPCNSQEGNGSEFVSSFRETSLTSRETPEFFFLPSLLGPGEPSEAWTYKCSDSWKVTLCHSLLFPDGVPPGMMERITAVVLRDVYAVVKHGRRRSSHNKLALFAEKESSPFPQSIKMGGDTEQQGIQSDDEGGPLRVHEILCWRTAFLLKLGMEVTGENGEKNLSIVEVFASLVEHDSPLCVASDLMGVGMRRLIVSGNGQVGDGGRKIWKGGYELVMKAIGRVMTEYGGLEFEKHAICPECLAKKRISQASVWDWNIIQNAVKKGDLFIRCSNGHRVPMQLVSGLLKKQPRPKLESESPSIFANGDGKSVADLLGGVVLVGLWCGESKKIISVGSGFVVDKKRGLIVTAAHTLINIDGRRGGAFGENYYGLKYGKVVIGVIPPSDESEGGVGMRPTAVFRYFARIVAKDEMITSSQGKCEVDACVLRITKRMENDVGGQGEGCQDQVQIVLMNDKEAMKREKLQPLKCTETCSIEEEVRILGYNQGGEGLMSPGVNLNRCADFARGYVCKIFKASDTEVEHDRFKPKEEIVVMCSTIGGHSGGPCVNRQGEVIGILSRADPAEKQRCYLVPTSQWKGMVKKARKPINPMDEFI